MTTHGRRPRQVKAAADLAPGSEGGQCGRGAPGPDHAEAAAGQGSRKDRAGPSKCGEPWGVLSRKREEKAKPGGDRAQGTPMSFHTGMGSPKA